MRKEKSIQDQIAEINQFLIINETQISRLKQEEKDTIDEHMRAVRQSSDKNERLKIL